MRLLLFISLPIWLFTSAMAYVRGQCVPASPSCTSCAPLTSSNQNISSGTYCVTTSISNLNLNGSAVICVSGAGQITNGNINGGTIIYNGSTATNPLNVAVNGGTLRIRSNITLTNLTAINSSGTLVVENGATLKVDNLDVNGKLVVGQGSTMYVNNNFGINSGGSVCFDNGIINANNFTKNDQANSTTTVSKGCYAIRSTVGNFNQPLTSTSSVYVCLPGAAPNPNKFGSATLNPNCSNSPAGGGCLTALPVRLVSFQAQSFGEGVRLTWISSLEQNFSYYQVERSTDALHFEAISAHIAGMTEQADLYSYQWTDSYAQRGTFYYRLKQVDLDNTYTYSKIAGVTLTSDNSIVTAYPNPVSDELTVSLNSPETGTYVMELYSATGKLHGTLTGEKNDLVIIRTIATQALPTGFYFINIHLGNQHFIQKIIRQ